MFKKEASYKTTDGFVSVIEKGEPENLIKNVGRFPQGKSASATFAKLSRDRSEGFLPYSRVSVEKITEEEFSYLWRSGQPLVIIHCLNRFQKLWTPDYFNEHYMNMDVYTSTARQIKRSRAHLEDSSANSIQMTSKAIETQGSA
jgi:hypothetical protein